jgi:hypothetical protein
MKQLKMLNRMDGKRRRKWSQRYYYYFLIYRKFSCSYTIVDGRNLMMLVVFHELI